MPNTGCRPQKSRTLHPLARHWPIPRRYCRPFRSPRALPWALMVPSFRGDCTMTVKNGDRWTDTK